MSSQLEELWLELFNQNITPIEASLLAAVDRKVDSDSPLLILASLMVRMQYLVLVENKDSPFRALASVRRTMDEHRRSVEQISETYHMLRLNLSEWNGILARTEHEFYELREFGRAAAIGRVLANGEEDRRAVPRFVRRMMYLLWGGCFVSAGAGAALVSVVLQ